MAVMCVALLLTQVSAKAMFILGVPSSLRVRCLLMVFTQLSLALSSTFYKNFSVNDKALSHFLFLALDSLSVPRAVNIFSCLLKTV